MCLGTVDFDGYAQRLGKEAHGLQTLLNKDTDVMGVLVRLTLGGCARLSIETDERVDLKICCVDSIEAGEEVDEGVAFLGRHVDKERVGNGLAGEERGANRDGEDNSFGIDIADMSEEDRVTPRLSPTLALFGTVQLPLPFIAGPPRLR